MKLHQRLVGLIACLILAVLFSVPSQAKIDPETIVGQWLFDEDKGEKVIDASGNGHDGEIKGSNKRVKGKFGNALEVGADTWVMVPPDDKLKLTAYTVTIWLNTKSDCGGWCGILSKSNDNPTRTYSMYVNANTKVAGMSIGNEKTGKWTDINGTTKVNDGKWHHIAISYDEKEKVQRIYTNGKLEGQGDLTHDLPQNDGNLVFMAWHSSGGNAGITGMIDEIGLYNTVLDDATIKSIHDTGLVESVTVVDVREKLATQWSRIKSSP